jgi:iron(III) transport system ATP-binding protein
MSIRMTDVTFQYDMKQIVLNRCSFEMNPGDIVALIGKSGSGKSTILRLISGLERPKHGEICIMNEIVFDASHEVKPHLRPVGMVFQDYALFPHLSVSQNIGYGISRMQKNEKKARIDEMLELVGLTEKSNQYPHELSGGQQQRVALARALARKPMVLLLDEPFSNLDETLKVQIRNDLQVILKKQGISCLFATHDIHDARHFAHRIIHLEDGSIVSEEKCL